jgi:peptidoglycan hydrolase-like protein with peptidoglycan-binding domain
VAIVLVLSVLAAFGVFSGSGSSPTTPPATTAGQATTPAHTAPVKTPTQSSTPASLPAVVLKPGASGTNVKSVQRALASAGQSPGPIDGVYGPKTEQAVSAFQGSAGITVDGVYGPQTKKALEEHGNSG